MQQRVAATLTSHLSESLRLLPSFPLKFVAGLPWWLSGKESACPCRRHGLDPPGRSHVPWSNLAQAPQRLSLGAAATEAPGALRPVPCRRRSHCSEKPGTTPREQPLLTAVRKSLATKIQHSQKCINKIIKNITFTAEQNLQR